MTEQLNQLEENRATTNQAVMTKQSRQGNRKNWRADVTVCMVECPPERYPAWVESMRLVIDILSRLSAQQSNSTPH